MVSQEIHWFSTKLRQIKSDESYLEQMCSTDIQNVILTWKIQVIKIPRKNYPYNFWALANFDVQRSSEQSQESPENFHLQHIETFLVYLF